METSDQSKQTKHRNPKIAILISLGMVVVVFFCWFTISNCWGIVEYAEWEFYPLLDRTDATEAFHLVQNLLFAQMLLAIVSSIVILFFLVKILRWKKYGFWGMVVTAVVTTTFYVISSLRVVKAFKLIEVGLSYDPIQQVAWGVAPIALLFLILQIKQNGVSCWKQLE